MCCCNFDDGGRNGGKATGELNGMFGKTHTEEVKQLLHDINSGRHTGSNNSQYGISPKDRMDSETYNIWYNKQLQRRYGESNPNYGNNTLHNKYLNNPLLSKEKQSRPAEQNGRAVEIYMYDSNMILLKHFSYIGECVDYIILNNLTKTKDKNAIRSGIFQANKNKRKYYNYYFYY